LLISKLLPKTVKSGAVGASTMSENTDATKSEQSVSGAPESEIKSTMTFDGMVNTFGATNLHTTVNDFQGHEFGRDDMNMDNPFSGTPYKYLKEHEPEIEFSDCM